MFFDENRLIVNFRHIAAFSVLFLTKQCSLISNNKTDKYHEYQKWTICDRPNCDLYGIIYKSSFKKAYVL